jgi:hypothetical protein
VAHGGARRRGPRSGRGRLAVPTFYQRIGPGQAGAWATQPPSPELDQAKWLLGDWDTAGHVYPVGEVPELDGGVTRVRCSLTLSGHALKFAGTEGEETGRGVEYLSVNPYDGAWQLITFEPNVVCDVQRTPGWRDGVLEFEGPIQIFNDIAVWRHRLVKASDDEWRWENDEQQADGSWRAIDYHWYRRVG